MMIRSSVRVLFDLNARFRRGMYWEPTLGELRRIQWSSPEEISAIQESNLQNLLNYTFKNIPYYNKLGIDQNTRTENPRNLLTEIPFLTKEIISGESDNLVSKEDRKGKIKNSSGGSTGIPTTVYQDLHYHNINKAKSCLVYDWAGWKPGKKKILLWGAGRDIESMKKNWRSRLYLWAKGIEISDSYRISDSDYRLLADSLATKNYTCIEGFVDSIYSFAKVLQKENLPSGNLRSIIATGSTLYPDIEDLLREVFNTKIINRYGGREVGAIASSCGESPYMHIFDPYTIVEILDKNGNPCKPGEEGNIYVTCLTNYTMPMIRYDIGDIGIPTADHCSCGRGFSVMERVIGRKSETIKNINGDNVSTLLFPHIIGVVNNSNTIKQFQVVQDNLTSLKINVVPTGENEDLLSNDMHSIKNNLMTIFGEEMDIRFEILDEIKRLPSGKYSHFIGLNGNLP